MKRTIRTILAVTASTMLVVPGAAFADPGGGPSDAGDCGLGSANALSAIADQTSPGATEYATLDPIEFGCTGKPAP